jgi:hypothetical protein
MPFFVGTWKNVVPPAIRLRQKNCQNRVGFIELQIQVVGRLYRNVEAIFR